MARPGATAVGGYYPTPSSVIPAIAKLVGATPEKTYAYCDPCAGEGTAVLDFIEAVHGPVLQTKHKVELYSIELEQTRHEALKSKVNERLRSWRSSEQALRSDAFQVAWEVDDGVDLLWLNPPYDLDPQHGRLEEKFLSRFAPSLASGGILVFLVPFYALKASAATLGKLFDDVHCFRFPTPEFEAYKQVVLVASKRAAALWEPDAKIHDQVLAWARDADAIPVLSEAATPLLALPVGSDYKRAFKDWKALSFDVRGLLERIVPWTTTDRMGKSQRVPGILPEAGDDFLVRKYPVAMPPRSAHIAAGIAAGIFNGSRITPDDPKSPLPPLLVKGVFDKEFRTVDEKLDKDGNVKGLIQVQQPKLVTTVLNLETSEYVTIKPTAEVTGTVNVSEMTMADLLAEYGRGLMSVMLQQCPVLHDPSLPNSKLELPKLERPLYDAQAQATMAAIKLLGGLTASKQDRRHKATFVLGEIGSGKTSVALAVAEAIRSKRVLVMCPPHLLASWEDQVRAVVPWFRTVILNDVADVQQLAIMGDDTPTIAILSRETAKLGHANISCTGACSGCGEEIDLTVDHAKKRSHCISRPLVISGGTGQALYALAVDLLHVFPDDARAHQLIRTTHLRSAAKRWAKNPKRQKAMWDRLVDRGTLDRAIDKLLTKASTTCLEAITSLLVADPRKEAVLRVARALYVKGAKAKAEVEWSNPPELDKARSLLLLLPPADVAEIVEEFKAIDNSEKKPSYSYGYTDTWTSWEKRQASVWTDGPDNYSHQYAHIERKEGILWWNKSKVGDRTVALDALLVAAPPYFKLGQECGEPLYQAVPEPRRFPVATFIARKYPSLFDLLILDEGHEYASDGSAQERSAHRLTSLGIPTLLLTGTIMNGYAESMFMNMWALSEDFRCEFDRDERTRFVDRFGYRKRLIENKDKETGKIVEYGSVTDRVERIERNIGDAPGVLPLFLLRYLLPLSVTIHKTDLTVDIPKCTEFVEKMTPSSDLKKNFERLQKALVTQIRHDRFVPELAGKLWGAMAELPSYLDNATEDTGNADGGYEIRYPESVGGTVIAKAEPLPASTILPKEAWMLKRVEAALEQNRNVMVFAWHTKLLPRLARLIEKHLDVKCPVLDPGKVPTKKRQAWIDQEIVKKRRRVLVVNPVTIQTGLNNLVYFADELWMENPACNPVIYRQAVGRVDRIGQNMPTSIYFPIYEATAQEELHSLLLHKVAVSMSTDGLDAESALQAAGVGENTGFSSFAVGRQLYEMLTEQRNLRLRVA